MVSKPLAAVVLVLASVTAAAGGAYLAIRHNNQGALSAASAAAPDLTAAVPMPETEAMVEPPAPAGHALASHPLPTVEPEAAPPARAAEAPRAARTSVAPSQPRPAQARPAPAVSAEAAQTAPEQQPRSDAPPVQPEFTAARAEPAVAADAAPSEVPRVDPPRARERLELEVPSASVIGLRVETPVSTETARVEDRVEARVLRDVAVDGRTAIPAGTRALGAVTTVERGGKMKERARLGVRFHTLVLADGTQLPIRTDTILREGDSPAGESARKIGGAAVGGAILGALMGGKKGAVIGSATGAAGGTAVVMAGDRNAATLPAGAVVTVRLSSPVLVEVERD